MTSPMQSMRALGRRSMPAMRVERSVIAMGAGCREPDWLPPVYGASVRLASERSGSAARRRREGLRRGAQLLHADRRRTDAEQLVDMVALEEGDADRLAELHRLLAIAAAEDDARPPK